MDGFSLIIGGLIGALVGWAFASGSVKQQDASRKKNRASEAKKEITKKRGEAKSNQESSFSDSMQSVLFYVLGCCLMFVMGLILFSSL